MNTATIVGRLVKKVEIETLKNGKKIARVVLAVPRTYKNEEGVYDTDFIQCIVKDNMAITTSEYCRKGDAIGIRGAIETFYNDDNIQCFRIVADKVTFISSGGAN